MTAAWRDQRVGLADNWLRHVQDVRNKHAALLAGLPDDDARLALLAELNVLEQVVNVCQTTVVQDAWARQQPVVVHGFVYSLEDGLLRDLGVNIAGSQQVTETLRRAAQSLPAR